MPSYECEACGVKYPPNSGALCQICGAAVRYRMTEQPDANWQAKVDLAREMDGADLDQDTRQWRLERFTQAGAGVLAELLAVSRIAVTDFERLAARGCRAEVAALILL